MKQLNLLAPIDLHDLLRSVAKAAPDEAQLIAAALAPNEVNNEPQLQRWKCQRGILDAPPEKLIQIQKVLAQAPLSSTQKAAMADQERTRRANQKAGQVVRSLRGWRRLVVRLIIGPANVGTHQKTVGSTTGSVVSK